jgi:hypothetical protein
VTEVKSTTNWRKQPQDVKPRDKPNQTGPAQKKPWDIKLEEETPIVDITTIPLTKTFIPQKPLVGGLIVISVVPEEPKQDNQPANPEPEKTESKTKKQIKAEIREQAEAKAREEREQREAKEKEEAAKMKKENEDRAHESDYGHTQELFGKVIEKEREKNNEILISLTPNEEKDFLVLANAIANRVEAYSIPKSIFKPPYTYISFLKDVAREITEPASVDDVNDLINFVTATLNDKVKKSKPKQKPKILPKKKLTIAKGTNNVDIDEMEMDIDDRDDGYDFM